MKCPKCGFENLDEANFCIKCGSRIDEKIPCPKCGEYISNDAEHCPHCGKAIPHKSKANIERNENAKGVKAKIAFIFNHVSCYVTLFLFIALIAVSVSNAYIFSFGGKYFYEPYSYFIEKFKAFSSLLVVEQSMTILQLVFIILDIGVTLFFGIRGIKKTAKAFKNYEDISKTYKYLGVLLAAKLLTPVLLSATIGPVTYFRNSETFSTLMGFLIFHLSMLIGFDCFMHFKRGQISIFISRVILGLGIYIPLILMNLFASETAYPLLFEQGYAGFIYHFGEMIFALTSSSYHDGFIQTFIFSSINLLVVVAYISTLYYFIVFYVTSYFKGLNKFKKFRIAFYMSTITLAILSTFILCSSLIEYTMLASYLGSKTAYWGSYIGIIFLTILLIGVSVTTFNIYNIAARRAKLEEKTTTK